MSDKRLISQSFLGPDSDAILDRTIVGVVGLGGGGSHVTMQLGHLGVGQFVLVDPDIIERKNLNRLIGGTVEDVEAKRPKIDIATRVILNVNPAAEIAARKTVWQEQLELMRSCDVIFGCVDSYRARDELERFSRRFLIPYIDIGMDVHEAAHGYAVAGQAVLSSPGRVCLWCLGILSEGRLAEEAAMYGLAGPRPQVVWPNGVLGSLAVGLFVQLVCPWHDAPKLYACCEFDGNRNLVENRRLPYLADAVCRHHNPVDLGDHFFTRAETGR